MYASHDAALGCDEQRTHTMYMYALQASIHVVDLHQAQRGPMLKVTVIVQIVYAINV